MPEGAGARRISESEVGLMEDSRKFQTSGKNIVICSDGTGNVALKGRGTNVFKLFESIDLNGHRTDPDLTPHIAFYDDGVGTEDFKPVKIFAGATGFGLSRNVRQLYKELVRVYDPGDRLFLFGFSRGAFTVRTLAGLIATCGILDVGKLRSKSALEKAVRKAYQFYRGRYRTWLMERFRGKPETSGAEAFKKAHCLDHDVKIEFIGVWDTVDAVGLPFHIGDFINLVFYRFKFPDQKLSAVVQRACHALSIDDERHSFHPLLWRGATGDARIEQVWFSGAHSNVGGGYPKQGMSLVALDWMMTKAAERGLRLLDSDRTFYRHHGNVDDKLYDPRAGFGVFYRWKPRDIAEICTDAGVRPLIHISALERAARGTEDYVPGKLPVGAQVVFTPSGEADKDEAAHERARELEKVLAEAQRGQAPLLDQVSGAIGVGRVSYYVYVVTCLAAAAAVVRYVAHRIGSDTTSVRWMATTLWFLGGLGGGFLLSYLMTLYADRRTGKVFSEFWYGVQGPLRAALKRARSTMQGR